MQSTTNAYRRKSTSTVPVCPITSSSSAERCHLLHPCALWGSFSDPLSESLVLLFNLTSQVLPSASPQRDYRAFLSFADLCRSFSDMLS